MTGTSSNRYDYIIAGTGCAGLSLAVHLIRSGKFSNKRILLVDQSLKNTNDRTWCFWERKPGPFEGIVYSKWDKAWFRQQDYSSLLSLAPYQYKLIRGIDFYNYCTELIARHSNFEWMTGSVTEVSDKGQSASVKINGEAFEASYVFNSIILEKPVVTGKDYYLLQHFKGWVIETDEPVFNPDEATLMDFRVSQAEGTTFVYVMPFAVNRALVEYTLFSEKLLPQEEYDKGLQQYIAGLTGSAYCIEETEYGIIPMTNYTFAKDSKRVIHLGTAGGQTKASSGYTFNFIQKHSAALVNALLRNGEPVIKKSNARFDFYDRTLLHILQHKRLPGDEVFRDLFKKNRAADVLRFLDNESSVAQDLRIISTLPTWPFLKAALRR